jgi:predicted MPP superfamily phosphohydrolase
MLGFFVFIAFNFHASKDNYIEPEMNEFSLQFNAVSGDTLSVKEQYRIAVVSDLHLGYIIDKTVLEKYIQLINAQQPDIIVIDGDLIDYYLDPLNEQQMGEELKNLQASQGVYFIPGNHEYKTDPDVNFNWIRETGIPVLRDSVINIGHHLQFIGRDDRRNKKERMDWDSLMVQSDTSRIRIFFTHQPNDVNQEVLDYNLPLIVSGHTHGGQLFPMNLLNSWIFPNNRGMKQKGDTYFYTTTGIGLSGFPFRISTQSEFVIFNIEIN